MDHFLGKMVNIKDKDGNLVAILFADMPSHLSENALEVLRSVFPNLIQSIRSVDQKDGFYSLHFSYYNRYCKKVSSSFSVW